MNRIRSRVVVAGVPTLIEGANRVATLRVRARDMLPGDSVGSGETVISVSAGVWTPSGKVDVILDRADQRRAAIWGAQTEISVTRAAQGTLPGAEPISAAEHANRLAQAPLRPTVAQRSLDIGLFGDEPAQLDLVDMARAAEREGRS